MSIKDPRIPTSMAAELAAWNNGAGIDLEGWVGCSGNFQLAVGYSKIFWPDFEVNGDYILRADSSPEQIEAYESQEASTPQSVEGVMNHLHLADIQYGDCPDISPDKLIFLGKVLKEI
jgi:hypothetical protein